MRDEEHWAWHWPANERAPPLGPEFPPPDGPEHALDHGPAGSWATETSTEEQAPGRFSRPIARAAAALLGAKPVPTVKALAGRIAARSRRLALGVSDVLYPPSCLACQGAVGQAGGMCAACWRTMPLIERPFCERLGIPFALDLGAGLLSPAAMAQPPVYGRARAVARYDGPARDLVHRLKFSDRLDLAPALGLWMARAGAEITMGADALVPIPLHPIRLWRRRFNQAALLASAVSRHAGVPCRPDWLARRKATRPQVGLTRAERADNLQGSFSVPASAKPLLEGKRVVLVDDVLTTGATVNAAARVLLRAGSAQVDVLTFARVTLAP